MINQKYYTYIYLDPRKSGNFIYQRGIDEVYCFNHEPFYVGKGCDERLFYHLKCKKSDKNLHKKNTIKKIRKVGLEPIIIKVLQNVTDEEAFAEEINLISLIGRADKGLGSLTNMTHGGDGGFVGLEPHNLLKLEGRIFNRLVVLENNKSRRSFWLCRCDCGIEKYIRGKDLVNGKIISCGCLRREKIKQTLTIHDMSKTSEFYAWKSIVQRCYNLKNPDYGLYGGKGIKMGDRWKDSFENFYDDMGEKPSDKHVLGRIDKDSDFEPSNCEWMTRKELNRSGGNVKTLTIDDKIRTMVEWSKISGIKRSTIWARINTYGWSPKEAVFGRPTN